VLAYASLTACGDSGGSASNERDAGGAGKAGGNTAGSGSTGWGDASTGGGAGGGTPDGGGAAGASSGGSSGSGTGGASGTGGTGGTAPCATIVVKSAIYAANCGAPTTVSSVAATCNGQQQCSYTMNYQVDPGFDPAYECAKDMTVEYDCVAAAAVVASKSAYAPPEAGNGSVLNLECTCAP
jgi:hypothetical protein